VAPEKTKSDVEQKQKQKQQRHATVISNDAALGGHGDEPILLTLLRR